MIRIERGEAPDFFESERYERMKAEVKDHFTEYGSEKRKIKFSWRSTQVLYKETRDVLLENFRGKCAYCETEIGVSAPPDVEQYRPKVGTRGLGQDGGTKREGSTYFENHYWWLALEWNNMLIACQSCNRFKGSWFPLADESKRAEGPGASLDEEEPLLLDPCSDNPEKHLRFTDSGNVEPLSERGRVTIDTLNLNRSELVEARLHAFKQARHHFESVAKDPEDHPPQYSLDYLAELIGRPVSKTSYLAIQRQFLEQWGHDDPDVMEAIYENVDAVQRADFEEKMTSSTQGEQSKAEVYSGEAVELGRLAIEKIELHNFKNIADLTLNVPTVSHSGGAPWLVFLGENAVGKSSILQAVVLTLMGDKYRVEVEGITPEDVLRHHREDGEFRQEKEGWVKIWVSGNPEPLTLEFSRDDPDFHSNVSSPHSYLLAYGSTRLLPEPKGPFYVSDGLVRVRNLFKPTTPLADVSEWLYQLCETDPAHFDLMIRGLRQMLLMRDNESISADIEQPDKRRILIDHAGETSTLGALSDGYRSILALAGDLMYMFEREGTSMAEAEGIVVIDEIGTNLHPGWKKRIVGCLREVFPRIQFLATTHDPLCLRGLFEQETILLRRDFDGNITPISNLPNPNDLRVDELLTSEYFGLNTTLETDLEEIYDEYYKLLTLPEPTEDQSGRMADLKEKLRDREHLGHGLRDELMYEVIDKLLAEQLRSPTPMDRKQLKKETLKRVLESWKQSGLYEGFEERS